MSGVLPNIFSFNTALLPEIKNILVIGCGGTGAYTIAFLSRIISTLNYKVKLYIADGDVVESKNLSRQHFITQDLNRNKAEVLAERYSSAFGIEIIAINKEINSVTDLNFLGATGSIIIGCVDNNASRKIIHESSFLFSPKDLFWIDSGNEEKNGQVVVGFCASSYNSRSRSPFNSYASDKRSGIFSLPNVFDLYPEMLNGEDKLNSELSCAERSMSAPQNMMTNLTAATIITNYTQKILFKEKLNSHATTFTINNVFSTRLNTIENLIATNPTRLNVYENTYFENFKKEKQYVEQQLS